MTSNTQLSCGPTWVTLFLFVARQETDLDTHAYEHTDKWSLHEVDQRQKFRGFCTMSVPTYWYAYT